MITCQSCQHEEYIGALFCSLCGIQLHYSVEQPISTALYSKDIKPTTGSMEIRPGSGSIGGSQEPLRRPPARVTGGPRVALRIFENEDLIPLEGGAEFTLGRVSGNQPILPDIDLTGYQAYESGVSRLHASIKVTAFDIAITDLGSANGTRVNGQKLTAHEPHPLESGDVLTLGRFRLQILIRN
ncbi:MAG: FHA domain-containing protein [Chloroflexi bacterium]|nr:FHA domain-containing protein [Chloroflexota bacterium]